MEPYCKRFAQSAGPGFQRVHFWSSFSLGSEKGRLLALVFSLGALFGAIFGSCLVHFSVILVNFSFLGALWELGANFFIRKTVWTTKGAPIGISPKMASLFWSHFGVIFRVFFDFWGYVVELRFLLSPGIDFSWILASCRHNFLIFFLLVGTSGFSDF